MSTQVNINYSLIIRKLKLTNSNANSNLSTWITSITSTTATTITSTTSTISIVIVNKYW